MTAYDKALAHLIKEATDALMAQITADGGSF